MTPSTDTADPRILSAEEIALIGTWLDARGAMDPDLADDLTALLAHAAREDVLNRAAKEFCAQAGFGWDTRTDDNKARLRECAKAALAAFLQDKGERT